MVVLTPRDKIRTLLEGAVWSIGTLDIDDGDRLINCFIASMSDEQASKLIVQDLDVIMMAVSFYFRGRADAFNEAGNHLRR